MTMMEIQDKLLQRDSLKRLLAFQEERLEEAEQRLRTLLAKYQREARDVDAMQGQSLSGFLLKVIGRYEERLDKEIQEEFLAKRRYDEAAAHANQMWAEQERLRRQMQELDALERSYRQELDRRGALLLQSLTLPEGQRYRQLEQQRHDLIGERKETDEALNAALRAHATARQLEESLRDASGWATYDLFAKSSILSHSIKYSHIDRAEQLIQQLHSQLQQLQCELGDLAQFQHIDFGTVSSTQRSIDFWFDNIFTDYNVRSLIQTNLSTVEHILNDLNDIETRLNERLRELRASLLENRQDQERLLSSDDLNQQLDPSDLS